MKSLALLNVHTIVRPHVLYCIRMKFPADCE
jgi:hypothetical protein